MYAIEFAKIQRSPEEFDRSIDRMLMYLGRYGYQDASSMMHEPTVTLRSWADRIGEFLAEEKRQAEEGRK